MLEKKRCANTIGDILFQAIEAPSTRKPEQFSIRDVGDFVLFGVKERKK